MKRTFSLILAMLASLALDAFAQGLAPDCAAIRAANPAATDGDYIISPGGVVTSGLAIYDTMAYIRPQVSTLCIGQAASAALCLTKEPKSQTAALFPSLSEESMDRILSLGRN